MDLLLTADQDLLCDSAARIAAALQGDASPSRVRAEAARAGLFGLLLPEDRDGAGLGTFELLLVARAFARRKVPAAFAATAIALPLLARDVTPDASNIALALDGDASAFALEGPLPAFRARADGIVLSGVHRHVPDVGTADEWLVLARSGTEAALVRASAHAPGLEVTPVAQADASSVGHLSFADVPVSREAIVARGAEAEALASLSRARLLLVTSAELLGTAETALALALDHARLREQFGRKIGSFQALQHRMVDSDVGLELLTSLLFRAAADLDRGTLHPATLHACKAKAGTAALDAIRTSLQIHGAIGYTAAHDLNILFRRAQALDARFGNAAMHQSAFSRLTLS